MREIITLAAEGGEDVNPLIPETYDIVWSIVCVVIIGLLFWKYVIPRVTKTLDERADNIEGGIARAKAAQEEAQQTLQQYQQQLADARLEAARIREDARTQGQQILAQMRADAQAESDRIVAAGHSQLEAQRQQILTELRSEVGRTAVAQAQNIKRQSV